MRRLAIGALRLDAPPIFMTALARLCREFPGAHLASLVPAT